MTLIIIHSLHRMLIIFTLKIVLADPQTAEGCRQTRACSCLSCCLSLILLKKYLHNRIRWLQKTQTGFRYLTFLFRAYFLWGAHTQCPFTPNLSYPASDHIRCYTLAACSMWSRRTYNATICLLFDIKAPITRHTSLNLFRKRRPSYCVTPPSSRQR